MRVVLFSEELAKNDIHHYIDLHLENPSVSNGIYMAVVEGPMTSTQTPYRAVALYNVFLLKRTASEVMDLFEQVANEAMDALNTDYKVICEREHLLVARN